MNETEHPDSTAPDHSPLPVRLPLYPEYRPSDRHSQEPIQHVYQAGLITALLALILMWAFPGRPPLRYVALGGLALGALLLLKGLLDLPRYTAHKTPWANRCAATQDHWFPMVLFGLQTLMLFLLVSVLWWTLPPLGVSLHPVLHSGLYGLLTLITIRRWINEWARRRHDGNHHGQEVAQLVTTILFTLLVATALTHAVQPFGHPITGDNTLPLVFIWVVAIFVVICCLILLMDRLFNPQR